MTENGESDICGAKKRGGEGVCHRPAGWGTDHAGSGRCKLHGGAGGAPPKHGLYSSERKQLEEKMKKAETLESPGELWGEVKVLRALLSDYLDRMEGAVDADEIDGARKLVAEIRKTINAISKIKTRNALTAGELRFVQSRLADMFKSYVPREDRHEALDDLKQLTEPDGKR